MRFRNAILCLALAIFTNAWSQAKPVPSQQMLDSGLIQFSGILLTSDSLIPIPFANVFVKGKPYGTYSNGEGYFSFVARKGDTVMFNHVEFEKSSFVIPDTLADHKYSIVKLLTQDTLYYPGVFVVAMPNRMLFDRMFATMDVPNDDLQRAKDNLEREAMKDQASNLEGSDASAAYKNITRMYAQKSYYAGQLPPMNIFNPFSWAQFIEAWKRGDYKRKKK